MDVLSIIVRHVCALAADHIVRALQVLVRTYLCMHICFIGNCYNGNCKFDRWTCHLIAICYVEVDAVVAAIVGVAFDVVHWFSVLLLPRFG